MVEELKPCPFCGGQADLLQAGNRHQSCIIECTNCGTRHESSDEEPHSGRSWNARVAVDAQPEAAPVGRLTISRFRGHLENHDFEYIGSLPEGMHKLYAAPQPAQEAAEGGAASGLSWDGYTVSGDRRSIDEVKRLLHCADRLKWFESQPARRGELNQEGPDDWCPD